MANSIEIIKPFVKELGDAPDVQIFGGIGSAALADERTVIDVASKTVIAPADLNVSDRRDNGSKRDIDVLVRTSNKDRIKEVESILRGTVGEELEQSVFGFRPAEQLRARLRHPLGAKAFMTFVADRYEEPMNGQLTKALFPFGVEIDPESLETWQLQVGDASFNIPSPAISVVNYTQRSIGGLRPKDADKIKDLSQKVYSKAPGLLEWTIDGPGASQVELTHVINSLGQNRQAVLPVDRRYSLVELMEHEAFMVRGETIPTRRVALAVAAFKANAMHDLENNRALVGAWQRVSGLEKLFVHST